MEQTTKETVKRVAVQTGTGLVIYAVGRGLEIGAIKLYNRFFNKEPKIIGRDAHGNKVSEMSADAAEKAAAALNKATETARGLSERATA